MSRTFGLGQLVLFFLSFSLPFRVGLRGAQRVFHHGAIHLQHFGRPGTPGLGFRAQGVWGLGLKVCRI